jgi:hypothetical protein
MVVEIDPAMYESVRHLAASAGLVRPVANGEWVASAGPQ